VTFLDIIPKYHVFIFDLWGVIHDGKDLFPWTLKTLEFLKKEGKVVAFLSNSPGRVEDSKSHLCSKGLTSDFYDFLYTSGEESFQFLSSQKGKNIFFIGPNHEKKILDGLDMKIVLDRRDSDFVLVTGLDGKPLEAFEGLLEEIKKNDIPMVCSNPDLGAFLGEFYIHSAGSLAKRYEEIGGRALYFGKPHLSVYDSLFETLSKNVLDFRKSDVVAVGDSLLTDIKGANDFVIDSVLVLSGITKTINIKSDHIPTYIVTDISI
jgi:HAD superfamily hydrolase (TIGR01459 family)